MRESLRLGFDANLAIMFHGDGSKMERIIDWFLQNRSGAGFKLSEIQDAMAIYRKSVRPLVLESMPRGSILQCLDMLDDCVRFSLRMLGEKFHAHHELELHRINRVLMETMGELKTERNSALAANALKDQFLANVSHELKTPLTSIIGFSKAMMATADSGLKEKLNIIYGQGRTLLRLINTLIMIAEIDAGTVKMSRDPVDLRDITDLAFQAIKKLKETEGRKIGMSCGEKEIKIVGDSEKLFAVVFELIHNALKFSEPDGEVSVTCHSDGGKACVEVSDNGIGIDGSELERIFDPFYQQDGSTTRRYQGSGIGLTMIKKVLGLHGGAVTVKSVPGAGSTFKIELPLP